jgi:hypothetical protein
MVEFRPFLGKIVAWPLTKWTRWPVLTELVLLRTSIVYMLITGTLSPILNFPPCSPVTGNNLPLHFKLPHQLTLSKMPLAAGKIYSFEEARKAAYPNGFFVGPSINALGERDPNIGVISVADGKNTEIKFSMVWLSPQLITQVLNM